MAEKKNKSLALLLPAFFIFVALISFGTFFIAKNATKREAVKAEDCESIGLEHSVEVKNDEFAPKSVDAKICDELTIINRDEKLRLIAFGLHNEHIYYNGVTEKILKKDEELTITLNQAGTYIFHDHLQEEVQGEFSVQ
ncbi:MAG TPA: cupredoxin domain-containing protein [Candidatus Saccharimonadales bacterium]|nr:cupredoxin domain-containing protein [Candidatus Saccharimonadales bacterium]